jgi:hypothetical protein
MQHKIFISSTFGDLIPYRKRIWDEIGKLNVKILGMEKFGARKSAPLETCLEEVGNSDIFIGIISFRFGSIDRVTIRSFSQLEYEKAYALKKEIMIYFMSDEALIYPSFVDKGINASRLINFKKILRHRHTIDTFKEPDELVIKIQERLRDLISDLVKKRIRPKKLDCEMTRFSFNNEDWIAFVGYLNDKPFEIFTGLDDPEIFPIPKSIINGNIVKVVNELGKIRYDFRYTDKYGYTKSIGGLSHIFSKHTSKYCSIITKLLQKDVELSKIADVIDDMDLFDNFSSQEWKKGVKKALRIK